MTTPRFLSTLAGVCLLGTAFAADFTPGNLVVTRIGDGSATLTSAATPVFLDEYDLGGNLVQSIALPTTVSGANRRLTSAATSTSEMALHRSADNKWLTLGGYDADLLTAAVSGTTSALVNRVIGRVGVDGTIDTSTALNDAYSTSNIRAVVTSNGTDFWTGGTGAAGTAGVRYTTLGSATTTQLSADVTNTRWVNIFNGQLYVSTGSGAFKGVSTVGTGLPTTGGQTTAMLNGFDTATTSAASNYGFFFSDANTLYVADDRNLPNGGIDKWTYDGSIWTKQYTLSVGLARGCRGVTGLILDGQVRLYATQAGATAGGANDIVTVTDIGATSTFTSIVASPANTCFRGIAWTPEDAGVTYTSGFDVIVGSEAGGDLDSLLSSDDNALCIFNDDVSLIGQIEFYGNTTVSSPTSLTFTLEYQVYRVGLSVQVDLFRFSTNTWVAGAGGVAAIINDETLVSTANVPTNFVGGGGELWSRVTWSPINDEDPSQDGWLQCVDLAQWDVN